MSGHPDTERHRADAELVFVPRGREAPPDASSLGGKGRSLALLAAAGLDVPPFVVATVAFFERAFGDELARTDAELQTVSGFDDPGLPSLAAGVQARLSATALAPSLVAELNTDVARALGPDPGNRYAVRSSAVDEDSTSRSLAGLHETLLFVAPGDVVAAACRCAASAFTPRALSYRLANGLSIARIRIAVVIQRMVDGHVSGVLFTGNPANGVAEEMVVDAAPGLGEGIVSGDVDPDGWIVDERGEIVRRRIGEKRTMYVLDRSRGRGTTRVAVDAERQRAPCLSDAQVLSLATLGLFIEMMNGGVPQDVEWTLSDGRFQILQARPITGMAHVNKQLPRTILDNSNIVESYSGVTSPLTFSFASAVYTEAFVALYQFLWVSPARLEELADDFRNLLVHHRGRVYYRLNGWYAALSLLPGYETHKQNLDLSLGVSRPADLPGRGSRVGRLLRDAPRAALVASRLAWLYLRRDRLVRQFSETFDREAGRYLHDGFAGRSNRELLAIYARLGQKLVKAWAVPLFNDFLAETFFGALSRAVRWCGVPDCANLENDLLCGQGGLESVRPTEELLGIARWISTDAELTDRILRGSDAALAAEIMSATSGSTAALRERIEAHLRAWGHRCADELKLESTPLRDDPRFLFGMLRNYLARPPRPEGRSDREREIRARAEERAFAGLSGWRGRVFAWVLENARERIRAREDLRLARTRLFGVVRNIIRALAANLVRDGVLDAVDDAFFLTQPELWELAELRSPSAGFVRELVRLRKAEAERQRAMDAPERLVFYGDVTQNRFLEVRPAAAAVHGGADAARVLRGIACSPGIARGAAKVARSADGIELRGEILVTERTDPGWIPLFPCVGGLVIERGSVLSHSAVVAREMGIPTVVGVRDATRIIQTGDIVKVDGGVGEVVRESEVAE